MGLFSNTGLPFIQGIYRGRVQHILRSSPAPLVEVSIDLGFGISLTASLRLFNIRLANSLTAQSDQERQVGSQGLNILIDLLEGKSVLLTAYPEEESYPGNWCGSFFLKHTDMRLGTVTYVSVEKQLIKAGFGEWINGQLDDPQLFSE